VPRPVSVSYRVLPTAAALALAAAEFFASVVSAAVAARGVARVALSGGTTPKGMFALLADRSAPTFALVPWERLQLFWVDERCVPPTDAESNYRMTEEALLEHVPVAAGQIHRMEGELDPEVAFRLEGAETPAFDLVLLGLGEDGHTASLFPHTEALNELGRIAVANHVPQKKTWRITLTWPVIQQGREVAFLIEGAAKAQVVRDVFRGAYDPEAKPAQLIRPASGRLTLLLDAAAAAMLPRAAGSDAAGSGSSYVATLEI